MNGVILAAGRGKRLKPLTDTTPKALLKVGNKPIIDRIIQGMKFFGINQIAIVTNYLEDQIIQYTKSNIKDIRITFYHQKEPLGTGDALMPARDFVKDEPFLLNYGDIIIHPENYSLLKEYYNKYPSDSIIGGWLIRDPSSGGVLVTKGDHLIDIIEKPKFNEYKNVFINAGVMILQPELFEELSSLEQSIRGEIELTDAIKRLAKKSSVRIYPFVKYWSDIGTLEKLREANQYFSNKDFNNF